MLRFLVVGLLNTGFGYASYAAFVLAGAPLWLAVTGSTALGFFFNFYSTFQTLQDFTQLYTTLQNFTQLYNTLTKTLHIFTTL